MDFFYHLLVSLLNFWCLLIAAQLTIVLTYIVDGEDVLLPLCNMPPDILAFVWYRGQGTDRNCVIAFLVTFLRDGIKGPACSRQESITLMDPY